MAYALVIQLTPQFRSTRSTHLQSTQSFDRSLALTLRSMAWTFRKGSHHLLLDRRRLAQTLLIL
jgi:hypothetical protein